MGTPSPPEPEKAEPVGSSSEIVPKQRSGWRRGLLRHLLVVLFIGLWIGAVVYPDPRPFVTSIARLKSPPVDAAAVAGVAATLPNDYKVIENFSLDYVEYLPAWTVYRLPWYFPTVQEVLRDHAGDCQGARSSRRQHLRGEGHALHPALLLRPRVGGLSRQAVHRPWKTRPRPSSPTAAGGWLAKLPTQIPLWSIIKVRVGYHWTPMPLLQKIMILLGTVLIIGWGEKPRLQRLSVSGGLAAREESLA